MNRAFYITILLSLLVHLAFFAPALWYVPVEKEHNIEVTLSQPMPEPKKADLTEKQDLPPPSRHLEDDITKANASNGTSDTAGGKPSKAEQRSQATQKTSQIAKQIKPSSNQLDPKQSKSIQDTFDKELEVNETQEQSEQTLLGVLNEEKTSSNSNQPQINEYEEEKARWYNEVLKRISEQVEYIWIRPEGISKFYQGKIKMDLDSQGYLLSAWIDFPSGSQELDSSALLAIRGVIRYQVPKSPKLSQYYRHLIFEYRGVN